MYGMIHKSLRDLIVTSHGDEQWSKIMQQAASDEDEFLSLKHYEDEVVLRLLGSACEVTQESLSSMLSQLGKHFILVTATEHYGDMIKSYGANPFEMLENVNMLHSQIRTTFLDYKPPSFEVEKQATGIKLHYKSSRTGLSDFVTGILEGLATLYNQKIVITTVSHIDSDHGDYVVFDLQTA